MDTNIKNYLEQLLVEAGQKDLPAEVRDQLLIDLNQRLEQRLILAALGAMTEKQQNEMEKLAERKASMEEVTAFVKANVADSDKVFGQAFADFKALYLEA